MNLKPVGQRPRCLFCNKELAPNYRREFVPFAVKTGVTSTFHSTLSGEVEIEQTRSLTEAERKQFRKDHPPVFLGTYGRYRDNLFCGLTCGYRYAVQRAKSAFKGYR